MAEEDKKLLGSEFKERLLSKISDVGQSVSQRAQEDDPDSWSDEVARLAVGTAQTAGAIAGAPVIKETLSVLDFPFYMLRQSAGAVMEHGFGVDPWYGQTAVGVGEVLAGGKGLVTGARKATTGIKKVQAISKAEDIMNFRRKQELGLRMMSKIDDVPDPDLPLRERLRAAADRLDPRKARQLDKAEYANVTRPLIEEYVRELGGTSAQAKAILAEEVLRHSQMKQSVRWLNEYFEKLVTEVGEDGLKHFNTTIIDGKPTLIDRRTGKGYKWAFEKDHIRSQSELKKLGLRGSDFSENLEIQYTVFNRAKSDALSKPPEFGRLVGRSQSLRELVRRRLDADFDKKFNMVPQELRQAAETAMLDELVNSIGFKGKPRKQIKLIEARHRKFWSDPANQPLIMELERVAQTAPAGIQNQIDEFIRTISDPTSELRDLQSMQIYESLRSPIKKRLRQRVVKSEESRGLRGRTYMRKKYYREGGHDV